MLASINDTDLQVEELERTIRGKEKEIKKAEKTVDNLIDELIAESTERVKEKLRKRMDEISQHIEEFQADIEKKRASIKDHGRQSLNQDEIVEIFQYVAKVIKSIEDKEKQQSLIRKLVAEILVEDKHMKEVHFRFFKSLE